jgi:Arc/MetJ-type ribon-helix-helix transcriptional regulator
MKTFQISLPDEDAALVERMLQDGPWESVDELFLNSLGTLQEDVIAEEAMNLDYDEVKRKLQEAGAQCERGVVHLDEEILEHFAKRFAEAGAQS